MFIQLVPFFICLPLQGQYKGFRALRYSDFGRIRSKTPGFDMLKPNIETQWAK